MIKLLLGGGSAGTNLLPYFKFLRGSLDYKLKSFKDVAKEITSYYNGNSLPSKGQLKPEVIDDLLLMQLTLLISDFYESGNDSAVLSKFAPFAEIFRIQRDFLFNAENRLQRLTAGVRLHILKAVADKNLNLVYI